MDVLSGLPAVALFLRDRAIGGDYGVGVRKKLWLLRQFRKNRRRIETLTHPLEQIEMAAAILRIPKDVEGDVVECGCYLGGTSANLSLVSALTGRRLIVCDSFEGLPEPAEYDRAHFAVHTGHTDTYEKAMFAASLETVRDNISRCGNLEVCEFVVGFFDRTLPGLDRKVALAFLDVDLIDSLKSCIEALWPNLQRGRRMYVHEARNIALASVFFDAPWWRKTLDSDPPGLVGAGSGLALQSVQGSELGYAQKTRIERAP